MLNVIAISKILKANILSYLPIWIVMVAIKSWIVYP